MIPTCNGVPADAATLAALAQTNFGHFSSMQVRAGAVRGLGLHLRRLVEATSALFGTVLDPARLQGWMRDGLAGAGVVDASLRVTVFSRQFDFREPLAPVPVDVLVAVGAPVDLPPIPRRVRTVVHVRDLPQIKHVGTFGLFEQRRQALRDGFDDALFTTPGGLVSEGTTWNLALLAGDGLAWPQAPALRGVTERLLQQAMGGRVEAMPVSGLAGVQAAIACNATGIWPLAAIDGHPLAGSEALCGRALAALARIPAEPL